MYERRCMYSFESHERVARRLPANRGGCLFE